MHQVIESLLDVVKTDPLPVAHTSSHWQRYGSETVVEQRGDGLILQSAGFGLMRQRHPAARLLGVLERLSYRPVTSRLRSYPALWRAAQHLARDLSFDLTYDVWRQTAALAVLADHWAAFGLSPRRFALIGDGHGFLGALIHRLRPDAVLYCIDLPKMLVFQAQTHATADPDAVLTRRQDTETPGAAAFVLPQEAEAVLGPIDCAVNIASLQEMTPESIADYFAFLRSRSGATSRFYCVNRLRKELPGGETTSFLDYPWQEDDEVFLDGRCPYYTHTLGLRTRSQGPRLLGVRVPFINAFDGPHMHRLVRLAPRSP